MTIQAPWLPQSVHLLEESMHTAIKERCVQPQRREWLYTRIHTSLPSLMCDTSCVVLRLSSSVIPNVRANGRISFVHFHCYVFFFW